MKKKIWTLLLGVVLILPGVAVANGTKPRVVNKPNECCNRNHHQTNDQQWQEKMKQKEQRLLSLVKIYTPEKQQEWGQVIKERNDLRNKWLSPELSEKREQWKKTKMRKLEELHKQYEQGKITKEDFIKKAQKNKVLGNWKIYHELKNAIKSKNDIKTGLLLNQLLVQYKKQNEMMKAAMNS